MLLALGIAREPFDADAQPSYPARELGEIAAGLEGQHIYAYEWYAPSLTYYSDRDWHFVTRSEIAARRVHGSREFAAAGVAVVVPPWPEGKLLMVGSSEALRADPQLAVVEELGESTGFLLAWVRRQTPAPSMPSTSSDSARSASDAGRSSDATVSDDAAVTDDAASVPADQLVDIKDVAPNIVIEMRYATVYNFTGVAVYPEARCLLRAAVAKKLALVQAALEEKSLGLKVWDCYRPISVQQKFWDLVPDPRYVAKPVIKNGAFVGGSKHNRGAAGRHHSGRRPSTSASHAVGARRLHGARPARVSRATPEQQKNSAILEAAMVEQGFEPLATEWWHFDGPNWRRYPLEDRPLSLDH